MRLYAVIQVLYRDPEIQELCKKLVDFMLKRVKQVLKAGGGNIQN